MKKVLVVFGTRPEAIKLVPVIFALRAHPDKFRTIVCTTGQHRQMLDQVLGFFGVTPDHDIGVMLEDQNLFDLTSALLGGLRRILDLEAPDLVVVQGDTTTSFVAGLAAFYRQVPVAHVEAGLRTYDLHQPFPEEANRHMLSVLADHHFAPTEWARRNLLRENVPEDRIWVTGNTGIDALLRAVAILESQPAQPSPSPIDEAGDEAGEERRLVLVTGHRRESFGPGFERICRALRRIADRNPDVDIVYPVHLNPNVRKPVFAILGGDGAEAAAPNIRLIEPLDYAAFVALMQRSLPDPDGLGRHPGGSAVFGQTGPRHARDDRAPRGSRRRRGRAGRHGGGPHRRGDAAPARRPGPIPGDGAAREPLRRRDGRREDRRYPAGDGLRRRGSGGEAPSPSITGRGCDRSRPVAGGLT